MEAVWIRLALLRISGQGLRWKADGVGALVLSSVQLSTRRRQKSRLVQKFTCKIAKKSCQRKNLVSGQAKTRNKVTSQKRMTGKVSGTERKKKSGSF